MEIIDSHHHFWNYDSSRHSWIDDEMSVIRKDFLPKDLIAVYAQNEVNGCVSVQVDQTEEETLFLLNHAKENDFVKGVVGWVDLRGNKLSDRLDFLSQYKTLKGFRHILQGEKPEFMLHPDFLRGVSLLGKYNFTYDILIMPHHLKAAIQLVKANPTQKFVICHMAKPYIKAGKIDQWALEMKEIAQHQNVYCKVSGMVTEADYSSWKLKDFFPYLDVVVEAFGMDRLMYGSDWPVCLVAASYSQQMEIVKSYFSTFSELEMKKLFGLNAMSFYNL